MRSQKVESETCALPWLKMCLILPFFYRLRHSETWRMDMARIGYARVSSVGQSLEVQLNKLKQCDKIYQEKRSGATGKRPSLEACREHVREGDKLVVTRLNRLARSTLHLCQIAEEPKRKQVHLQVLDQGTLIWILMRDERISKAMVYRYLSGVEADTESR